MKFWKERGFAKKTWLSVATLVIGTLACATTCFGGIKMEPLYDINEATTIRPEEYKVRGSNLSLFPVPQANSVGTNDMGNAITLLSFHKGRLRSDKYFNNAAHDFEGGGTYLPVIDQDTIGFAQSRRFLLFDFKSTECRDYRIVMAIDKTIRNADIANPMQKHFIFEIKEYDRHSANHRDYTQHLLLMDLSENEPKLIKEMEKGKGVTWKVFSDKIFLYHIGKEKLEILNTNFEPSSHPLANIVKKHGKSISFTRLLPHPFLPFAILYAGDYGATYITWRTDRDCHPLQLFSGAYDFSFSPDGKWVVFKKENFADDTIKTYLMPVSEKYPNYLGSPILLHDKAFGGVVNNKSTWTTNPISFVGSRLDKLYRWELTNEAHPESDKPTFHDYIVEKDLEKLTREKRQGLGDQ